MFENARGIVLRTRRLTESSLIVSWLAGDQGRVATVAKGALRPKSPFRGKLDLFYVADFSFARSRRSELHTLRDLRLIETHSCLRMDLASLQQAEYCVSLLEQTTENDTPLPGFYELMLGFIGTFDPRTSSAPPSAPQRVLAFELRLLSALGLEPDLTQTRLSSQAVRAVGDLQNAGWIDAAAAPLAPDTVLELRRFLHGFLIQQFGRLAKGRDQALQ